MKFSRRLFGGAVVAAAFALAGSFSPASAGTAMPYSAEAFKAAQASGSPILIDTQKNVILGRGGFSFRNESLDFAVRADAKKWLGIL